MLDSAEAARERQAIEQAIARARAAVDAVNNGATADEVQDAEVAITAIETAIMDTDNVPANEKSVFDQTKTDLMDELNMAKTSREMAIDTQMTAKKLYDGIKASAIGNNEPGNGDPVGAGLVNAS